MELKSNIYQLLIGLLAVLWSVPVIGADEAYINSLKGTDIAIGRDFMTQDALYDYMSIPSNAGNWENRVQTTPAHVPYNQSKIFTNTAVNGYVSLRWEGSNNVAFTSDWYYKVKVRLSSWGAGGRALPTVERILMIDYRVARQTTFKDWDVFQVPGADKIKVEVLDIQYSTDGVNYSQPTSERIRETDIYLETKIMVERAYAIGVNRPTLYQNNLNSTDRTVTYAWNHIWGAEEYDFEWLFISDQLAMTPGTNNPYTYENILDWDNASRVSLTHNQYTLELPYESGRVYFRVRAVGYGNPLKARLVGYWSPTPPSVTYLDINNNTPIKPLNSSKNWTYSANYAEQGKRVESLVFADGTGRGRQSVTKDNTNDRAVVAETVFDREGRQSMQVIPSVAPSADNQMSFHQNYNLNVTGKPIHWTDFDTDAHYQQLGAAPIRLSKTAGASQYFSSSNPDIVTGTGLADFVPDADGMPYTRTVFDNQGRVLRQGGVGKKHSVGKGHDTRYFYATALQADLDELFGSEVGYEEHYSKQMVVDPNGQRSISYTNLSGQTVATALVGMPPTENGTPMVDALDRSGYNYTTNGRQKESDLASYNELEWAANTASWVVRKEIMIEAEGNYKFNYSPFIGVQNLCIPNRDAACEFELRINIYDGEGNNITGNLTIDGLLTPPDNNTPIPTYLGNFFTIKNRDNLRFTFAASVNDIGSYTIVKELRLRDVTDRVNMFYASLLQYKTQYQAYIEQAYKIHQHNLLEPNPNNHLTPPTAPTPPPCINFDDHVQTAGDWLNPCLVINGTGVSNIEQNYCSALKFILQQDLLPNGQYFDNSPTSNSPNQWLDSRVRRLSTQPLTWKGITYSNWNAVRGLAEQDIKTFMKDNGFFKKHPEWCIYEDRCLQSIDPATGNSWYEKLLQQNSKWMDMDLAAAQQAGYLNIPVVNGTATICNDPLAGPNTATSDLANYSMFSEIIGIVGSGGAFENSLKEHICNSRSYNNGSNVDYYDVMDLANLPNPTPTEQQWTVLRGMMLEAKQWAIDARTNNLSRGCRYLNDGNPNDNKFVSADGFAIRIPSYEATTTQIQNNTGVSTSNGNINNPDLTSTGAVNQTQLTNYANNVWQNYALCGHYEVEVPYNCITVDGGFHGRTLTIRLDIAQNANLVQQYGVNQFNLAVIPEVFHLCSDSELDAFQRTINANIASLPAPLKTDLTVTVLPIANSNNPAGTGSLKFVVRLPGSQYNANGVTSNNTYQGVRLLMESGGTRQHIIANFAVVYVDCNQQGYTTCVCEEIKSLNSFYTNLINNGQLTGDVYTAMAKKYNLDLGLTGASKVNSADIQYVMEGYCGFGDVYSGAFQDFTVDRMGSHLPVAGYPIGSTSDYNRWKAIFKADPHMHTALHDALLPCLEINTGLSCKEEALALGLFQANEAMDAAAEAQREAYRRKLLTGCMKAPAELFKLSYTDYTMHHTLYYYDAAGNLVKTVPPTGVTVLSTPQALQQAKTERANNTGNPVGPNHRLVTTYEYNTLNNVTTSTAPDRGTVATYYDKLGRAVLTQNAQQQADGAGNYVIYDALGRVAETGVAVERPTQLSFNAYKSSANFQTDLDNGNFPNRLVTDYNWIKKEVRTTTYNSNALAMLFESSNNILRNRVGTQTYSMNGQADDYRVGYSYDVFGNAQEVWQHYPDLIGNAYKQLLYDYDLISGVVHQIDYQKGKKDQLSFRYTYDANNRLVNAKSTTNGFIWNTDARYEYYLHGPLRRLELGDDKVQGVDYAYTMHGWIKGVNSNKLQSAREMGLDGVNASGAYNKKHDHIARDVFGYGVHYYQGDYTAIQPGGMNFLTEPSGTGNLYNGNISSVTQAQTKPAINGGAQRALPFIWKKYRYDMLHRITQAQTEEAPSAAWAGNNWNGTTAYQTHYSYGPNGNILRLKRYAQSSTTPIDNLTYRYTGATTPTNNPIEFANNQLLGITDAVGNSPNHNDIYTQPSTGSSNNDQNYRYDLNGSLTQDLSEEIANITWTSEKKLHQLVRGSNSTRANLRYIYDFQGNRIAKIEKPAIATQKERHQVYVRDPQGNTLAIYEYLKSQQALGYYQPTVHLKEQVLYGSDRLATLQRNIQIGGPILVLGNGLAPSGGRSMKQKAPTAQMAINGYLEYTERHPQWSYEPYTDTLIDTVHVTDLDLLSRIALEEWDKRNGLNREAESAIFQASDPILQRLERVRGYYRYELKNFRGDIRQIITDVKHRGADANNDGKVDYYTANVIQVDDSYPFGWAMKERSFSTNSYRFGFNGKENDREWGNQLIQDYGFRLYNPAIGKFLSVDPLAPSYPSWTPYAFAMNRVIDGIDLDGLEWQPVVGRVLLEGAKTQLRKEGAKQVIRGVVSVGRRATDIISNIGVNHIVQINMTLPVITVTPSPGFSTPEENESIPSVQGTEKSGIQTTAFPSALGDASTVIPGMSTPKKSKDAQTTTFPSDVGISDDESVMQIKKFEIDEDDEGYFAGNVDMGGDLPDIEVYGKITRKGKEMDIDGFAMYPVGEKGDNLQKNKYGITLLRAGLSAIKNWAKTQGMKVLRLKGERHEKSSSANPGMKIDKKYDLD